MCGGGGPVGMQAKLVVMESVEQACVHVCGGEGSTESVE